LGLRQTLDINQHSVRASLGLLTFALLRLRALSSSSSPLANAALRAALAPLRSAVESVRRVASASSSAEGAGAGAGEDSGLVLAGAGAAFALEVWDEVEAQR